MPSRYRRGRAVLYPYSTLELLGDGPLYTRERDPVPLVQEPELASRTVWTGAEILARVDRFLSPIWPSGFEVAGWILGTFFIWKLLSCEVENTVDLPPPPNLKTLNPHFTRKSKCFVYVSKKSELGKKFIVTDSLQGSCWTSRPLKTGPIGCTETPVNNYQFALRNIPEGRRSHLHRDGSLK